MKKVLSLFMALVMLCTITAGLDFSAQAAAKYTKISNLQVPRFYQDVINGKGDGSCNIAAVASAAMYARGNNYNNMVYYYGKDYSHSDSWFKYCLKKNGNSYAVSESLLSTLNFTSYNTSYNLTNLYNALKSGKPVVVYRDNVHASVVIGYKSDSSSLTTSNFIVMEVSEAYPNKPGTMMTNGKYNSCYTTLSNWTSQHGTPSRMYYPKTVTNPSATVYFNGNGGTVSQSSGTYTIGKAFGNNMPSAVRNGYAFDGWYTSATGGTKYSYSSNVASSDNKKTLYAHWIPNAKGVLKLNRVYKIISHYSNLPLQTSGSSNGSLVKQQERSDSKSQMWRVSEADSYGNYRFKSINGGKGLDLDCGGNKWDTGKKLQVYTPSSNDAKNDAQRFSLVQRKVSGITGPCYFYSIHSKNTGKVLDVSGPSTEPGAQVHQYPYHGKDNQIFFFEEVTDRSVIFYDNQYNNYIPTPKEVSTELNTTSPTGDYYSSRNTAVATVSIDNSQNMLVINQKSAGSIGKDLWFDTSLNPSYNYDFACPNTSTVTLSFTAKSTVPGAKMYFRFGYDSGAQSVTLSSSWQNYEIIMPRTENSGDNIHPYIDRASTVYMKNIALSDYGTKAETENGDTYSGVQSKTYKVYESYTLPSPIKNKSGYKFMGWYDRRTGGNRYGMPGDSINAENILGTLNLYGHWEKYNSNNHTCQWKKVNSKNNCNPTCTSNGAQEYACSLCNKHKTDKIAAKGHNFGKNNKTCSTCGASNPNYKAPTQPATKPTENSTQPTTKPSQKPTQPTTQAPPVTQTPTTAPTQPIPQPTVSATEVTTHTAQTTINITKKSVVKKPKKAAIKKLKKGKKSFKVYWKKLSGVTGYQIQYSTDKKFKKNKKTVTVKGSKNASKTIKKLKGGKKYYVRVRAYKKGKINGTKYTAYGSWSKTKTVKTKK